MFFDEEEDELLAFRISRALAEQGSVKSRLRPTLKYNSSGSATSLRRTRTAVTAKHGQVVVKILSFGHGRQSVRNQASYISRKAELALEDQDGNLIEGSEEVKDLIDDWSADFSEFLNARDSMHMQVSVPIGSDREAAHDAVRAFAKEVFSENHEYVLVRHDDTEHPHSHIVVKTKGYNGKKLNPRKKDLTYWRDVYAHLASERGILLDSSSRRSRGQGRKGQKMAVVKLKERGGISHAEMATALEVIDNPTAMHPAEELAKTAFEDERREFAELGIALKALIARGGETGDRAAALLSRVHDYTMSMTPPKGIRAEMRDIVQNSGPVTAEGLVGGYSESSVELEQHDKIRTMKDSDPSRER